jgi:hypothetical protein
LQKVAQVVSYYVMLSLFYRSNFCAECGNEQVARRWWNHPYLCRECTVRVGGYRRMIVGFAIVPVAMIAIFMIRGNSWSSRPDVSAVNTIVERQRQVTTDRAPTHTSPIVTPEKVQCGARTLKGTPCKRRVPAGERCAQHKGRPSILAVSSNP